MDFDWTDEQRQLYERIRRFAHDELSESASACDRDRRFAADAWHKAAGCGLAGLSISPEYGGRGFDCLTTALALEAFGHGCSDAGLGFALAAHLMACCMPIDRHGTPAQKARYLPNLCAGRSIGANAITEPDAGSDAFAVQTRAVRDGDIYRLNGDKVFVTNAPVADVFLTYAATNPGRGMFSLSAFLVDRDTPGVTIGAVIEKVGLTSAHMGAVSFRDCELPASQRLGGDGAGAAIFHDSMGWERSCLFALWVGSMDRQLGEVIHRAATRRQFGRPIGANQAVSHRIADMKLRLESARLLLYRACWERSQGRASDVSTSLAKLAVSEAFLESSLDAVQIFGACGVLREAGIERYVRDALPGTIYSGTSEMHRELIARALGAAPAARP